MPTRIETGARYTTASGLPVKVVGVTADGLVLQSLVSDNRLLLPKAYPLEASPRGKELFEVRTNPYSRRPDRAASAACKGKDLRANVRARLYWFKRKGYRIVSSQSGPKAVPPRVSASQ